MKKINIDIETYSPADITKTGVYKYVEPDDFEVLMCGYNIDDSKTTELFEVRRNEFPQWFLDVLVNPEVEKWAFNANFEHTALSKATGLHLPIGQWNCTMVQAARAGYPMSLGAAAKAMGLVQQKDTRGAALIRYFSIPCKPTKSNGMRTRNLPEHDPEKWKQFKEYCIQDVVTEMAILDKVRMFPVSQFEKELWFLDQKINGNGVELDQVFVNNAISIYETYLEKLKIESATLTGLTNSNSPSQIIGWLVGNADPEERQAAFDKHKIFIGQVGGLSGGENIDEEDIDFITSDKAWVVDNGKMLKELYGVEGLTKESVKELLSRPDLTPKIKRVLELRQEMAKTSVKKYYAMRASVCKDGRCRGLLQFGGANRTMRWGGRLIQVQNLPQNHLYVDEEEGIDLLTLARNLVTDHDSEMIEMLFGNVPDTLSQLIRTAFVAGEGKEYVVGDFSAIEARVIAWVAGEQWRLDVFNTHGKIYEASAAKMFKVPLESISYKDEFGKTQKGENYALRAKGKVAELACGYQGGAGALINMGALKMGLLEEDLPEIIKVWRGENEAITDFWYNCNQAATQAIVNPGKKYSVGLLKFFYKYGNLYIRLPSGRHLSYVEAAYKQITYSYTKQGYVDVLTGKRLNLSPEQVESNINAGKLTISKSHITYKGLDQITKQWTTQTTYGGKLTENIVQAIARDCLAESLVKLDKQGYTIVIHVHDEVVIEVPARDKKEHKILIDKIMSEPIPWAEGLPLIADSFTNYYYKKD